MKRAQESALNHDVFLHILSYADLHSKAAFAQTSKEAARLVHSSFTPKDRENIALLRGAQTQLTTDTLELKTLKRGARLSALSNQSLGLVAASSLFCPFLGQQQKRSVIHRLVPPTAIKPAAGITDSALHRLLGTDPLSRLAHTKVGSAYYVWKMAGLEGAMRKDEIKWLRASTQAQKATIHALLHQGPVA